MSKQGHIELALTLIICINIIKFANQFHLKKNLSTFVCYREFCKREIIQDSLNKIYECL